MFSGTEKTNGIKETWPPGAGIDEMLYNGDNQLMRSLLVSMCGAADLQPLGHESAEHSHQRTD